MAKEEKMTLFGYGKTTKAIADTIGGCKIYDDSFKEIRSDERGNTFFPAYLFDPDASELEVTSPGIPPHHPLTARAKHLESDYDFFADTMPFSIWISGSNGKTTTTQMIHHLLQKRGAAVGGNIGSPLASIDKNASMWVLETSSFTLHYTNKARPNVYVLLPITTDHVSWHGSFEAYEAAKLKPFSSMQEGEMIIAPRKYQNVQTDGFFVGYETADDLAAYFDIDTTRIRYKGVFLLDALLALCVTKSLFDEVDYDAINAFEIGAHRQEEFFDAHQRLWVDDSKATNIDAAIQAVKRYSDKKVFLIVGGDDKGQDFNQLFSFLQNTDVEVFTIGVKEEMMVQFCQTYHISYTSCKTLDRAVWEIARKLDSNGVGLLAPATASFDQFSSYVQRGEMFQSYVKSLS